MSYKKYQINRVTEKHIGGHGNVQVGTEKCTGGGGWGWEKDTQRFI